MVASISARKTVAAAVSYFKHMAQDEYHTHESEAETEGEWAGRGAERLALNGPVSKSDFESALNGLDPKTGESLVQVGNRSHAPGWDMTFSAPKSVSVMWALSAEADRLKIERAHRLAVSAATTHLEDHHAFTRRGRAGAMREPVAGLTIARFHHHTSRDLDPQLHTHAFIFNTAPRRDGTWGTVVSRDLYKAQKVAGAVYRKHLASGLEREGIAIERYETGFRLKAVPRDVERAFSKRRQAIEQAAEAYGYKTPKGMEMAALRTRQSKRPRERAALFKAWQVEAKAMGFDLTRARLEVRQIAQAALSKPNARLTSEAAGSPHKALSSAARLLSVISIAAHAPSRKPGLSVRLKQGNLERGREQGE